MEHPDLDVLEHPPVDSLPSPKPAGGAAYYFEQRELSLAHDPRRRENYELFLKNKRQTASPTYQPIKMDVENVSRCNFRCTACPVSDWTNRQRAEDMTLESFQNLIDELYGLVEVKIQGLGEPMLQGDDFFAMIRHARKNAIWIRTTTNASLLHLRDNYKKLIDSDVNEVQISVDGVDEETYSSIRRDGNLKQVLKNCEMVNKYAQDQGVIRTKMWVVLQRQNEHQASALLDLAEELGFSSLVYGLHINDWRESEKAAENVKNSIAHRFSLELGHDLFHRGRDRGIHVGFWKTEKKFSADSTFSLCPWPFERAFVSSDNRIVPCCKISNPDVFELGEIEPGGNFMDVWNNPQYVAFREGHISGDIPNICQSCYHHDNIST